MLFKRDMNIIVPHSKPPLLRKFILNLYEELAYRNEPRDTVPMKKPRISMAVDVRHDRVDHFPTWNTKESR